MAKSGGLVAFTHKSSASHPTFIIGDWEKEQVWDDHNDNDNIDDGDDNDQEEMEKRGEWKMEWKSQPLHYLPGLTDPTLEYVKIYIYRKT